MRLILSIFLVIVAAVIFFVPTRPILDEISVRQSVKAELNQALDNAKAIIAVREALQDKYNQFSSADLEKLEKLLPNNVDNVRLIIDINDIAVTQGMVLRDISIENQASAENRSAGPPTGRTGPTARSAFNSLVLGFNVTGDYEALRAFLADLSRSLRLVDVISLSFRPSQTSNLIQYSLKVKTYWLNES